MSQQERSLLEKLEMLKILIDTHLRLEETMWQDKKAFREYIDAILDEMNETKRELSDIQEKRKEL